ncbi:MAG: ZIP family metal transporter, partial [Clostridia bacterium]|nr:ZIP family metal transporter [Clostridia bacterium]
MTIVFLTALGVGGATILGALLGFIFKRITSRTNDLFLSFAAGVMLAASIFGLIIPSLGGGNLFSVAVCISGIFSGAFLINILDKLTPHLHKLTGLDDKALPGRYDKVILFVLAIAIHNIP